MSGMSESSSTEAVVPASPREAGLIPPYAVIACSVVFFWSISIRAIIYTVMPTIAADLQLSSAMAGLVIAAMLLGYCVGSWWAGWLPFDRKNRIVAGVLLSVVGAALFGVLLDLGLGSGPIVVATAAAVAMILATNRIAAYRPEAR